MISVHEMSSPIDSPFHNDFGNYGTDTLTQTQTYQFQRRVILQYVINHSLSLIINGYGPKFCWNMDELHRRGVLSFVSTLSKRCGLSLVQFQQVCVVLSRYLDAVDEVDIPLKQVILGVVILIQGVNSNPWDKITGITSPVIAQIVAHLGLDESDLQVDETEMDTINQQMKSLIYARFNVV